MPGSGWNCHAVRQDARREIISIRFFEDFTELHGDRCFGDDGAVIGGIATLSRYSGYSHRTAEGEKYQGKYPLQFWYGISGRLS